MLLDRSIKRIASKELSLFFSSPVAYLFLGSFSAISLFVFFWGETFFARNISDVRPLFEWMPILLIFLTSALTMRLWSEERRIGTLEHILTQPVSLWRFVLGKFLACWILLAIALLMTLPLPLTVSVIGELDWGPVYSGYLAALLLGAAYLAVGLFVSSRSDNQIVSLIIATAVCGLLYIIGSPLITGFFGDTVSEWMRLLGTGSRFEDIQRGVIDFRDLFYYLGLVAIFLVLNTFSLERERWAAKGDRGYHLNWRVGVSLLVVNVLAANLWLGQIDNARVDTTEGNIYSISDATRQYLSQLQEPLVIRGYFSAKTHPLLSPLAPQLRDLIREYEVAGQGRVRVEFIDPASDPEQEDLINQKYAIRPVPFKVADRYQASVVNSYFNVLVEYGDEYQVLGFRDLIEIKAQSEADLDVMLRNPEYDITRAVKKVLLAYQSGGNLFDTVKGRVSFTAYVSPDERLPEELRAYKSAISRVLDEKRKQSDGRFAVEFIEPEANGGETARKIQQDFGFKPMVASLFDSNEFYFYMTLARDDLIVQIPASGFDADDFEAALDSGLKRFASGFTKTVAMVTPAGDPQMARFGLAGPQFNQVAQVLGEDYNLKTEDLSDGRVDIEADVLLLAAPKDLDEKQLFAVDQFLMRGGTVIAATSPFSVNQGRDSLRMQRHDSGLQKWLEHHGLTIAEQLVLDERNSAFPVPVTRKVGAFHFQEIRMLDYPYFVDLRNDGLNSENPVTSALNQLSLAWASPITIDEEKTASLEVTRLLQSSDRAWLSDDLDVMPQIDNRGVSSFRPESERDRYLLGAALQGRFSSYFADKDSPLLQAPEDAAQGDGAASAAEQEQLISSVIGHSAESARIILLASNDFVSDQIIQLSGSAGGSDYLSGLELVNNAVDWSVEDQGLLSIRSRGHFNRSLPPMPENSHLFWETANYVLAAAMLLLLFVLQRYQQRRKNKRYFEKFCV